MRYHVWIRRCSPPIPQRSPLRCLRASSRPAPGSRSIRGGPAPPANSRTIFGKDNFIEPHHGLDNRDQVTNDLLTIAKKLDAPLLATNDSLRTTKMHRMSDAMLCINSGSRLDDPDRFKFDGTGYYIKTAEEMRELFKDHPDAGDNTLVIAERCNVMFDDHEDGAFMPKFPCPEG